MSVTARSFFLILSFLLGKRIKLFVSTGSVYSECFPHTSGERPVKTHGSRDNCYIRKGSCYIPNIKNHGCLLLKFQKTHKGTEQIRFSASQKIKRGTFR